MKCMFLAQLLLMLAFVSNATPTPGDPPPHINVCNFSFGPNAGNCVITAADAIWDQMNGGKTTAQCRVAPDVYATIVANTDNDDNCITTQIVNGGVIDLESITYDKKKDTMMIIYNSTNIPSGGNVPDALAPITDFHYSTPDLGGNDDPILPADGGITGNIQVCNYGIPISSTSPCIDVTSGWVATGFKNFNTGDGWTHEVHCNVDEADLQASGFAASEDCLVNQGFVPGNLTYNIITLILDTKRRTTLVLANPANGNDTNLPPTQVSINDYKLS